MTSRSLDLCLDLNQDNFDLNQDFLIYRGFVTNQDLDLSQILKNQDLENVWF